MITTVGAPTLPLVLAPPEAQARPTISSTPQEFVGAPVAARPSGRSQFLKAVRRVGLGLVGGGAVGAAIASGVAAAHAYAGPLGLGLALGATALAGGVFGHQRLSQNPRIVASFGAGGAKALGVAVGAAAAVSLAMPTNMAIPYAAISGGLSGALLGVLLVR